MDSLLKARDVADVLNLKPATVYELAHRGVLPHVRIAHGKRRDLVRFRRSDLERFIDERSQPAAPAPDAA